MGVEEKRFKAALDGSIERRVFKAKLMGQSMYIDKDLKLIIPLVDFTSTHMFSDAIQKHPDMEWGHVRMKNGTVDYGNVSIFEFITSDSFYLLNGWAVYDKLRHHMRCGGWVESNEANQITAVYNRFIPLGLYDHTKSYLEVRYRDNTERKIYLPEYCEDASRENDFLAETFQARGLWYCTVGTDGVSRSAPLSSIVGQGVDRFASKGYVIRFPAGHMG